MKQKPILDAVAEMILSTHCVFFEEQEEDDLQLPPAMFEFLIIASEHLLLQDYFATVIRWHKKVVSQCSPDHYFFALQGHSMTSCLARSLEATGDLSGAIDLYEKLGQEEKVQSLNSALSGRPHWMQIGEKWKSEVGSLIGCRLLGDHSFVFFERKLDDEGHPHISCYQESCDERSGDCGFDFGRKWQSIKVIKDKASEPLLFLASPNSPQKKLELWKFDGGVWSQIETRGEQPQRRQVCSDGGDMGECVKVGNEIFLFHCVRQQSLSHTVFTLSLDSTVWRRHSLRDDRMGMGIVTAAVSLDDSYALLLRVGTPYLNEKADNEVVPKYDVSVLEKTMTTLRAGNATKCGDWWYSPSIESTDRSGYIAHPEPVKTVQVGRLLIVLSVLNHATIFRDEGTDLKMEKFDMKFLQRKPTLNVLDLETMEWRGVAIANDWLLGDSTTELDLIYNEQEDSLDVIVLELDLQDQKRLKRLLKLRNASAIGDCFTKPLKPESLKARKYSTTYLVEMKKSSIDTISLVRPL